MKTDRIVQVAAIVIAIVLLSIGGSLLPRITDSAGEPYLIVRVGEGDAMRRERVRYGELRKMRTIAAGTGAPFEITFDSGGETWKGPFGSTVEISALLNGDMKKFEGVLEGTDGFGLRYTDVAIDGAPPIVALGTALGAFRGLIVDYLWLKVNMMKEKGLFYEVMGDADLITKLQPRFGEVWGFHGHNMAYNISVLTNTEEERWAWVRAGIDLVRDKGLRYNPNDVVLHKELAFWFAHKLDGVADDAHLYYKRMFAREWHYLLGEPPYSYPDRVLWIKKIADAPETLDELEKQNPKVRVLLDRLKEDLSKFDQRFRFELDQNLLLEYGHWSAVKTSKYAQLANLEKRLLSTEGEEGASMRNRLFQAFERAFGDPELKEAGDAFIAFLRRKVLREAYNMDARLMYQFTRDTGPLDWRHPQAHALYWARKGGQSASLRYALADNVSKVLNNDRIEIQAMKALGQSGLMSVDPLSNDNPSRLNDPRWTKVIAKYFERLYSKYYPVAGAASDTFTNFYENYMRGAVRELYRAGDLEGAQAIVDDLNQRFGRGGVIPNAQYEKPLDILVHEWTFDEYEMQPEVARGDVFESLRRGFREGLLLGRKETLDTALKFARDVTIYFKENRYNDFVNKFGEGRMRDLIGSLESSVRDVLRFVLLDKSQPLLDRLIIYRNTPEKERREVYDLVKADLEAEFLASPLSKAVSVADAIPVPPGIEEYRAKLAAEAANKKKPETGRTDVERK
ncbi:MAG: hypothetical protein U0572_12775 [Phycisphaerales bacterium]